MGRGERTGRANNRLDTRLRFHFLTTGNPWWKELRHTTSGWSGLLLYTRYGWEENIIPMDQDWHHLAGTYDGTTIVWYGDGIRVGSVDREIDTEDNVQVGRRGHAAGGYWPGLVDEFRIYSYALSDEEIAYLATDGAPSLHIPIVSDADLYQGEAPGNQWINLKDYSVLANQYLDEILWP